MEKDPALQRLFQKENSVKPSEEFTNRVMRQLPERRVIGGWSVAFLILLWTGFGGWIWFWRADLLQVLTNLNWNLSAFRIEALTPYLAFLMGLAFLLWQTYDFFMKILISPNSLKS